MANLCITEVRTIAVVSGKNAFTEPFSVGIAAPLMPPEVEQQLAIGATSSQSQPFGDTTHFVMIETDTTCCLAFGDSPTAVVGYHRVAANEVRFYGVNPGQSLAVIASS